jgi:putative transposase
MDINPLRKEALDYYFANDVTLRQAVKHFNDMFTLRSMYRWIREDKRNDTKKKKNVCYSNDVKQEAIKLYTVDRLSYSEIGKKLGITSHSTISLWIERYTMSRMVANDSMKGVVIEKEEMPDDVEELKKALHKARLERDIAYAMFEVHDCPKEVSLSATDLSVSQKSQIVLMLRHKYRLYELLDALDLKKSSYYYSINSNKKQIRHEMVNDIVLATHNELSKDGKYNIGYRPTMDGIHDRGYTISEKVVRESMRELGISAKTKEKKNHYSSYMGQVGLVAPNILNREFLAFEPNDTYLTDISEFKLSNDKKIYLSSIVDVFNKEIVGYSMSTHPNVKLVMDSLHMALSNLPLGATPSLIHSDQGHHYQREEYVKTLENANILQSMSRKATTADNASNGE